MSLQMEHLDALWANARFVLYTRGGDYAYYD